MTNPKIMAHRGGLLNAPENTISAFKNAFDNGADAAECDVRVSKDGEFVLVHDKDFKRICGIDREVKDVLWAEMKDMLVFGKNPVANLKDLLALLDGYPKKELYMEICFNEQDHFERLIKLISQLKLKKRVYFLFFDGAELISEFRGDTRVRFSVMPFFPIKMKDKALDYNASSLCLGWVDLPGAKKIFKLFSRIFSVKSQIKQLNACGIDVSGGVANTEEEMEYFLNLQVNGIWTDDVLKTVSFLKAKKNGF